MTTSNSRAMRPPGWMHGERSGRSEHDGGAAARSPARRAQPPSLDLVALQLLVQRPHADAQPLGGETPVAADLGEGAADGLVLDVRHALAIARGLLAAG